MKQDKLLAEWFWTDRYEGSSAATMNMECQGVYRSMLSRAWRSGARLPKDHGEIQRAIRCTPEEWLRCWPRISRYWRVDGDHLVNDTQREVYAEALAAHQRASARGRAGATAMLERRSSSAQAQPKLKPPSPSPSPNTVSDTVPSTEPAADKPPRVPKPRKKAEGSHPDLIRHWESEWSRTRLGQDWAWTPKEAVGVARALKLAQGDVGEVRQRMTRLLESPDAWVAANAAPSILVSRWNQLAVSIEKNGSSNLLNRLIAQAEQRP